MAQSWGRQNIGKDDEIHARQKNRKERQDPVGLGFLRAVAERVQAGERRAERNVGERSARAARDLGAQVPADADVWSPPAEDVRPSVVVKEQMP